MKRIHTKLGCCYIIRWSQSTGSGKIIFRMISRLSRIRLKKVIQVMAHRYQVLISKVRCNLLRYKNTQQKILLPVHCTAKMLHFFPTFQIHRDVFVCIRARCLRETGTSRLIQGHGSNGIMRGLIWWLWEKRGERGGTEVSKNWGMECAWTCERVCMYVCACVRKCVCVSVKWVIINALHWSTTINRKR